MGILPAIARTQGPDSWDERASFGIEDTPGFWRRLRLCLCKDVSILSDEERFSRWASQAPCQPVTLFPTASRLQLDPEHRLTAEEERRLFEALIQSPTRFNIQHWRFVVLRDPELRSRLRLEFGNDQAQMTDASLLVLFTADVKAWQKEPERYWRNAPRPLAQTRTTPA